MMVILGVVVSAVVLLSGEWVLIELSCYMLGLVMLVWYSGFLVDFSLMSSLLLFDKLSLILVLLSFFISGLMFSSSYMSVKFFNKSSFFFACLVFLMALMLMYSFFGSSYFMFYVSFEAALIPIFLLVMGWGSQPERIQASLYMLFYTLFASLPLLLMILYFQNMFFWLSDSTVDLLQSPWTLCLLSVFFILAFLVKLPMYGVHFWLPKAHVEAPVAGSMILAALLLKLGSYGVWRVLSAFHVSGNLIKVLLVLGLVGGVLASFVCFVQVDMKALVAYSSIVHMGILLAGLMSISVMGFDGALMMMVGHGLVSSGLFFMVGSMYDRSGSRSVLLNKGLMVLYPSFTLVWFLLLAFNISAPPSLNLLSEIMLTVGVLSWSWGLTLALMLMNFMSMVYSFYLYAQSQQGKLMPSILSGYTVFVHELCVGLTHLLALLVLTVSFWVF